MNHKERIAEIKKRLEKRVRIRERHKLPLGYYEAHDHKDCIELLSIAEELENWRHYLQPGDFPDGACLEERRHEEDQKLHFRHRG